MDNKYLEETYNSLQFASRASRIKMSLAPADTVLGELTIDRARKEIKMLRMQLREAQANPLGASGMLPRESIQATPPCENCSILNESLRKLEAENENLKGFLRDVIEDQRRSREAARSKASADAKDRRGSLKGSSELIPLVESPPVESPVLHSLPVLPSLPVRRRSSIRACVKHDLIDCMLCEMNSLFSLPPLTVQQPKTLNAPAASSRSTLSETSYSHEAASHGGLPANPAIAPPRLSGGEQRCAAHMLQHCMLCTSREYLAHHNYEKKESSPYSPKELSSYSQAPPHQNDYFLPKLQLNVPPKVRQLSAGGVGKSSGSHDTKASHRYSQLTDDDAEDDIISPYRSKEKPLTGPKDVKPVALTRRKAENTSNDAGLAAAYLPTVVTNKVKKQPAGATAVSKKKRRRAAGAVKLHPIGPKR